MSNIKKVRKAVIPAAGLGTRFLPATKAMPKEMLPIVDKPAIQFIVEEAVDSGIEEILIITSSSKNSIIDHFDYAYELEERLKLKNKMKEYHQIRAIANMVNIHFIRQKEPLGLGHAILSAKSFINDEPFAVLLGDDVVIREVGDAPALKQCMDAYEATNSSIVGVQKVPLNQVNKYGIVKPQHKEDLGKKRTFKLDSMIEKPEPNKAPSQYAILGRYVLDGAIFDELKNTKVDKKGEIQLTDAILSLSKKQAVYAHDFSGTRHDIGSKIGFVKATIDVALRNKDLTDEVLEYMRDVISKREK